MNRSKRVLILCATLSAFAVACSGRNPSNTSGQGDQDGSQAYDSSANRAADAQAPAPAANTPTGTATGTTAATDTNAAHPPDNSGVNSRDANGNTLTAADQSNAPADVSTTQQIRKAIVSDKSLSTNAHNIKIITRDGMVTLRGPVKNDREKAVIEQKATEIAGQNHVQNELDITG